MPDPTPIDRTLCCGSTCGRGTEATGPCIASTYGRAIRQRAEAAGYIVVPAEAAQNAVELLDMWAGDNSDRAYPAVWAAIRQLRAMLAAARDGNADG